MANVNKNKAYHGTLTTSTVDTVTLSRLSGPVKVINRGGTNEIFYTLDGSTPTVGGDDCYVVTGPAGTFDVRPNPQAVKNTCVVKLISTGAMTYSVVPANPNTGII